MKNVWFYDYPVGSTAIAEKNGAITDIFFGKKKNLKSFIKNETPVIKKAAKQLGEYFDGKRKGFDLPLAFEGTDFQIKVWKELLNIPIGETRSYKDIAVKIGNPKACRAVGAANGKNKIWIIVPCHRVIGSNSSLTGYAGGLKAKEMLLDLEKQYA